MGYIRGLILGPFFCSVKLILLVTFVPFIYSGGFLSSEKVFVTIALFTAIRLALVLFLSFAIQFIHDTKVTFTRIKVGLGVVVSGCHWVQTKCHRQWFSKKTCSCYSTTRYVNSLVLILKLNLTSMRNI